MRYDAVGELSEPSTMLQTLNCTCWDTLAGSKPGRAKHAQPTGSLWQSGDVVAGRRLPRPLCNTFPGQIERTEELAPTPGNGPDQNFAPPGRR